MGPPLFPGNASLDGTNGVARAGRSLHFSNGTPQREGFCTKEDPEKIERDSGIRPERRLLETLKSWR